MPTGKPNAQTRASEKWSAKAGYMAKTYKLKRETAEALSIRKGL